jgi:DNA topoisomerase-2
MKTIEEKYRKLSDVDHVLLRPGMYCGSIKPKQEDYHLHDGEKFVKRSVTYNPAFLKIFDEIVSNSIDEHRRNLKLNEVRVTVNPDDGSIKIRDNGGIPVVMHAEHNEWIP